MNLIEGNNYWKKVFFVCVIVAAALLLRLYSLDSYSFWYDEASCVLDERGLNQIHPISKLLDSEYLLKNQDYLALYNHGVIYYWQMLVGKSEFVLRLSSVIFSLLSICMIYILGRLVFNVKTARIASVLLAISPFHIYYAQELRPYAAVCFLAMFSVFLFIRALETGKKIFWIGYVVCSVLNVYFHCAGLLMLFSSCIFYMLNIRKYKNSIIPFVLSGTVITFLLIPIFLTLYPNLQSIFTNEAYFRVNIFPVSAGKPTLAHLLATLKNFSIGYNISYYSYGGKLILVLSLSLFLVGAYKFYSRTNVKLVLAVLFIPIVLLFIFSQINPCYIDRYLFSIFPLYILGIAAGLATLPKKYSVIIILIIVYFSCFGLKNYYANLYPQEQETQHAGISKKLDIRAMARFIAENYTTGDCIIHTCENTVFPLRFYIRQSSDKLDLIEEVDEGKVLLVRNIVGEGPLLVEAKYNELHPTMPLASRFDIGEGLPNTNRMWVIFSSWTFQAEDSREYAVIEELLDMLRVSRVKEFDGFFLYELVSKKRSNLRL